MKTRPPLSTIIISSTALEGANAVHTGFGTCQMYVTIPIGCANVAVHYKAQTELSFVADYDGG